MGRRRRRTPREKKKLSLSKDRRNAFGENDKASRRHIPRAKAHVNRANRHLDQQALGLALGAPDPVLEEAAEQRLLRRRRKTWRKWPDEALGDFLERRRAKREK